MSKNIVGRSYAKYSGNVMQPISWLIGLVETLLLAGVLGSSTLWIQVGCFTCMIVLMAVFISIYIYWMLRDPNRLQSEGYNLEVINVLSDNSDAKLSAENKKSTVKVSERK